MSRPYRESKDSIRFDPAVDTSMRMKIDFMHKMKDGRRYGDLNVVDKRGKYNETTRYDTYRFMVWLHNNKGLSRRDEYLKK